MSKTCIGERCGKAIKGRTDKMFCSDLCRNRFHNKLKKDNNPRRLAVQKGFSYKKFLDMMEALEKIQTHFPQEVLNDQMGEDSVNIKKILTRNP